MRILTITALATFAAFAAAQKATLPSPLLPDLEALSQRVDKAHRPQGPSAEVTAFDGVLQLHLLAPGEESPQVDLAVKYLKWRKPDGPIRHLIRYKMLDTRSIERGRDQFGFWHLVQGKARDLTEQDATDRAACERDTNLARQLVRFLDPGAVLRSLTGAGPVREEEFKLGRDKGVPCETVEGGLAAFPLLQRAGEDAPVLVKIWVTKAEGRLLAIDAWPLADGKRNEAAAERVRLLDLRERDGLLVPFQLEHLFRDAEGKMRLRSRAEITHLSLRPKLTEADFDRPR